MELKSLNELKSTLENETQSGFPIMIFGQEKQLIKDAVDLVYKKVSVLPELNTALLEGDLITYDEVINACETLPVISDTRIVHIKNPQFLKKAGEGETTAKRGNQQNDISCYLLNCIKVKNEGVILLISYEGDIEYKNRLIGAVKDKGYILEFKTLKGEPLQEYVLRIFERNNKKINKSDLMYLISGIGGSLELIESEVNKLCMYDLEEELITKNQIDMVIHKNLEHNIFKMVDSLSRKDADSAISILNVLLFQREDPLRILGMIIRQYRLLFMISLMLEQKKSGEEIRAAVKLNEYVLNNMIKQSRNFSVNELKQALNECLKTDNLIKSSMGSTEYILETMIVKLCR